MIQSQSPIAARLYLQRLARLFLPWLFVAIACSLASYSWLVGAPTMLVLGWLLLVFSGIALFDLSKEYSRLAWLYYMTFGRRTRLAYIEQRREKSQALWNYPATRLSPYERPFNLYCPLLVLLAFWLLAAGLSWHFFPPSPLDGWFGPARLQLAANSIRWPVDPTILERCRIALIALLLAFSCGPYAWAVAALKSLRTPFERTLLWVAVPTMGVVAGSLTLWPTLRSWLIVGLADGAFLLFFLYIFASQRLWVSDRVVNSLLEQLSRDIRSSSVMDLTAIAKLIKVALNYNRVFILMVTERRDTLVVQGEAGDYPSVLGCEIPLNNTQALTTRAFQLRETVAWNDVRYGQCPYYHRLVDEPSDDTCAEIAVPIIYNGTVFGILDVQSKRPGVFGRRDVSNLETVGRVLGAAYAEQRADFFFPAIAELSDQLAQLDVPTDEALVAVSFDFANQLIGADSLFYCRLSPAGFPLRLTRIRPSPDGELSIEASGHRTLDPLVALLANWQPAFWTDADQCPLLSMRDVATALTTTGHPLASLCFWPIGTRRDPLGALLMTFSHRNEFDSLRKLALLTLAQLLASVLARKRYQDIMFKSYGRAELLVHNLVGRHGLKDGVLQRAATLSWTEDVVPCSSFNECHLSNILAGVDSFLSELQLAEGYAPPNFWHHDLFKSIQKYISNLPPGPGGRRPDVDPQIYPEIEREKPWVKLALYRLVVEAIENAIFHGKPGRIQIQLQRDELMISGCIANDGLELPPSAEGRRSSRGIYFLRDELATHFKASVDIKRREEGNGTIVSFSIPAMPITSQMGDFL
jgi:putative methionine-R-sulfoxide reductase with GAF domain